MEAWMQFAARNWNCNRKRTIYRRNANWFKCIGFEFDFIMQTHACMRECVTCQLEQAEDMKMRVESQWNRNKLNDRKKSIKQFNRCMCARVYDDHNIKSSQIIWKWKMKNSRFRSYITKSRRNHNQYLIVGRCCFVEFYCFRASARLFVELLANERVHTSPFFRI